MRILIMTVAALSLAGCAHSQKENPALAEFPGAQGQIENFYNDNATEDDWSCPEVQMDTIDQSKVVSQANNQVRMAVTYYFTSFDESPVVALTCAKASTPASSLSTAARRVA